LTDNSKLRWSSPLFRQWCGNVMNWKRMSSNRKKNQHESDGLPRIGICRLHLLQGDTHSARLLPPLARPPAKIWLQIMRE
jgi:hypothetical protein